MKVLYFSVNLHFVRVDSVYFSPPFLKRHLTSKKWHLPNFVDIGASHSIYKCGHLILTQQTDEMSQVSPTATTATNTTSDSAHTDIVISPTDFLIGIAVRVKDYTREAVEHLILTVFIYCVLCVLLYVGIVRWRVLDFRRDVRSPKKRVLLVIAHPDDECMFFGPTVLNFTGNKNCTLYVMCLSTGEQCAGYAIVYF